MPETTASDAKAAWLQRVLGISVAPATAPPHPSPSRQSGLAGWQSARATALTTLRALEAAIRRMDVPERDGAVILLRAIQANLTEAPTTRQQVAELQRYIETDDIVAEAEDPNGFGIKVELRRPLLAALAGLREQPETAARASAMSDRKKKSALGIALALSLDIGKTGKVKTGTWEAGWSGSGQSESVKGLKSGYDTLVQHLKTIDDGLATAPVYACQAAAGPARRAGQGHGGPRKPRREQRRVRTRPDARGYRHPDRSRHDIDRRYRPGGGARRETCAGHHLHRAGRGHHADGDHSSHPEGRHHLGRHAAPGARQSADRDGAVRARRRGTEIPPGGRRDRRLAGEGRNDRGRCGSADAQDHLDAPEGDRLGNQDHDRVPEGARGRGGGRPGARPARTGSWRSARRSP